MPHVPTLFVYREHGAFCGLFDCDQGDNKKEQWKIRPNYDMIHV